MRDHSIISERQPTGSLKSIIRSLSPSIWSSLLMAVGGMGDALLYAYLPVKGEALGMSAFAIGLLLSINKFVRFFTNRWMAWISNHWGIRKVMILGVILSASTTAIYGLNPALWLWVVTRLAWGAAYSALRFSTIQYADTCNMPGSALGIGRTIQEAGPLFAYWTGPIMLASTGPGITFASWAIILLALTPLCVLLPDPAIVRQKIRVFSISRPAWIDVWVFMSSFVAEGLIIVVLSRLIPVSTTSPDELILIVAFYISVRRILNMILSPLSGWISDRFNSKGVFHVSCILILSGSLMISFEFVQPGIVIIFAGSSLNYTLTNIIGLNTKPVSKCFDAITKLSTSRDTGSAVGSLFGLILFDLLDPGSLFFIMTLILISVWSQIRKIEI